MDDDRSTERPTATATGCCPVDDGAAHPPGRAVLVTGASRGLGAAMAGALADAGYAVFAGMRRPAPHPHPGVCPVALDVTDPTSIDGAVAHLSARVDDRGLFAVVNNAAVLHAGPLERASAADVDAQLRTNLGGPIAVTQAFLPLLRAGQGRVVNVSSVNAQLPLPWWAVYSATKAALVALSDALRLELRPWRIGVTVLTLGAFATDIRARSHARWSLDGADPDEVQAWAAIGGLVAMLDATAAGPARAAAALLDVLDADEPPAHLAVGDGIDDLLALAAQPVEAREAVLADLLAGAAADGPVPANAAADG
jgi:NAD(P)-dependent dehydrogenase (short-subunit alcohol dehydrogenase family)